MKEINVKCEAKNGEVLLKCLADIHLGSNFSLTALKKEIFEIRDTPNMYCVINGDLLDNIINDGRMNPQDNTMSPQLQAGYAVELFMPIKDKILCITKGNHENRTTKKVGIDLLEFIADKLGIIDRYSPNSAVIFLTGNFNPKKPNQRVMFTIFMAHGSRAGRRVGAKANAVEDLATIVPCADLYIHSHSHQALCFKDDYYEIDKTVKKLVRRTRTYVNTGAFLNWNDTYAETALYRPSTICMPTVKLTSKRKYFMEKNKEREVHIKEVSVEL